MKKDFWHPCPNCKKLICIVFDSEALREDYDKGDFLLNGWSCWSCGKKYNDLFTLGTKTETEASGGGMGGSGSPTTTTRCLVDRNDLDKIVAERQVDNPKPKGGLFSGMRKHQQVPDDAIVLVDRELPVTEPRFSPGVITVTVKAMDPGILASFMRKNAKVIAATLKRGTKPLPMENPVPWFMVKESIPVPPNGLSNMELVTINTAADRIVADVIEAVTHSWHTWRFRR